MNFNHCKNYISHWREHEVVFFFLNSRILQLQIKLCVPIKMQITDLPVLVLLLMNLGARSNTEKDAPSTLNEGPPNRRMLSFFMAPIHKLTSPTGRKNNSHSALDEDFGWGQQPRHTKIKGCFRMFHNLYVCYPCTRLKLLQLGRSQGSSFDALSGGSRYFHNTHYYIKALLLKLQPEKSEGEVKTNPELCFKTIC